MVDTKYGNESDLYFQNNYKNCALPSTPSDLCLIYLSTVIITILRNGNIKAISNGHMKEKIYFLKKKLLLLLCLVFVYGIKKKHNCFQSTTPSSPLHLLSFIYLYGPNDYDG